MKYSWILVMVLLFFSGCGADKEVPERVLKVGSAVFGTTFSGTDQEMLVLEEKFLTEHDSLELFFTPGSRMVWRIDLIIPEMPGKGDPCDLAAEFVRKNFSIILENDHTASLPGTDVRIVPAYDRGPAGVRISFTDSEYRKIFEKESSSDAVKKSAAAKELEKKILLLENAVISFYEDTGRYPANLDQLFRDPGVDRWLGPYIDEIPRTAEGKLLEYRRRGEDFEIIVP